LITGQRKCAENYNKLNKIIFFKTAISILASSNRNSFRLLLDKLLPYILFEKYIYILALKMATLGNQQCANCIGTLSFPIN